MDEGRRAAYASLWVLALAFGWIEASVVVYLREIYLQNLSLQGSHYLAGLQITLVSLPGHLVAVEMVREACTIFLLGEVAWLAGRRPADRAGAFLLSFGIWDLAYYAALRLVVGWPDSLRAWDILFLIPQPWVAPVWAPMTVATLFVIAGSYLFWTPERERRYRWPDIAVLAAAALMTIAAFLVEWKAAADHRVPERFPLWLFGTGVLLGSTWFMRIEWRSAAQDDTQRPWAGVRVRSVVPELSEMGAEANSAGTADRLPSGAGGEGDLKRVIWEYGEATRRLEVLLKEAGDLGQRFETLAHGLSAHPARLIIGVPERVIEDPSEWDVVPSDPLPQVERLVSLTSRIREASLEIEDLRERLILKGRADVVAQPDGFFH